MNKDYGTKWFTYFTKYRPYFSCAYPIAVVLGWMVLYDNANVWLILDFFAALTSAILNMIVYEKSKGDYISFCSFVKGVLLFETVSFAYSQGVHQYMKNGLLTALVVGAIFLLIYYFLWYRLNIKYFDKRILLTDYVQNMD